MKARDVPTVGESLLGAHQRLAWAVGDDGRYTGVATPGWEAELDANAVCREADAARVAAVWADALAGRASPLAYHMVAAKMDATLLAHEAGTWAWRVRRHLRPDVFARLGAGTLARYADALGLTVDALRALPPAPEP